MEIPTPRPSTHRLTTGRPILATLALLALLAAGWKLGHAGPVPPSFGSRASAPSLTGLQSLRREAEAHPDDPTAQLRLGRASLAAGDQAHTLLPLTQAAQSPRTAAEACEPLLDYGARFGQQALVLPAVQAAVAAAPQDPRTWEGLVRTLYALGQQKDAERILGQVLRHFPSVPRLRIIRAEMLANAGKVLQAVKVYEAALQQAPDARAQFAYAALLVRAGASQRAKEAFKRAIELDPASVAPYLGLAQTDLDLGLTAEAEQTAYTALQVAPEDSEAIFMLARALAARGRAEESRTVRELLERAVALRPANAEARYRLAVLRLQAGEARDAARDLEGVVARQPDRLEARQALARALRQAGDVRGARQQDELVTHLAELEQRRSQLMARVNQQPKDAAPRCELADFFLEQGAFPLAVREYSRALELDPGNRRAAAGLERARRASP